MTSSAAALAHPEAMHPPRGHSLIECLAALALFAVGSAVVGTALAHAHASQRQAERLAAATWILDDMAARIVANASGSYAVAVATRADCTRGCDAQRIAQLDVAGYVASAHSELGEHVRARVVASADGGYVLDLAWQGGRAVRRVIP
jgi:prepilin-type N-terminal cleavage/methylation domain-containing protein